MVILDCYSKVLTSKDPESLVEVFLETLAETNRTYDFFVDWQKVHQNVDSLKVELAILSSIVGSTQPEDELRSLLRRYPEATRAIPILVAVREQRFKVLEDVGAAFQYSEFDFRALPLNNEDIEKIVKFCSRTGIPNLLGSIKILHDYVYGVEVGLDSNARKNRSGKAMENLIYPILASLAGERKDVTVVSEKKFSYVEREFGRTVPGGLRDRRFDIVVLAHRWQANIETNFYAGTGSKPQEIVDAYLNRQRELRLANWKFIWITDGFGWSGGANQLRKACLEMDYILNAHFVRQGILKDILNSFD